MQALCELIEKAMKTGVLSPADLDGAEPPLIVKLEASPLAADWRAFRALHRTERAETSPAARAICPPDPAPASSVARAICPPVSPPDDRPWRQIPAKKRRIDPLVSGMGRVSKLDAAFAAELAAFLAEPQTEWILAV